MVRKFLQGVGMLALSAAMLFMPLMAWFLFYTTGELPMTSVRRAGSHFTAFAGTLVIYAVFFAIGLGSLRFLISDYLGGEALAQRYDLLAWRYVLPAGLVVGVALPLAIAAW